MRILFSTFGSYGDLYPYLALGGELRRRGHHVAIATSATYRARVESVGLAFHPVRPDVSLDDREMLAYVMDARRGTERIVRYLASVARDSLKDIMEPAERADLMVTHPMAFASVLAAQKLRKRWVSSVLAPISFFSACDPPVLAPAPRLHRLLGFLGPKTARAWMAMGKRHALGWIGPLLELRAEMGLEAGGNPLFEGQHSPSLVLAMFSRYLAARQPDWPPQTVVAGFSFFDGGDLPDELERFLVAGPAPVLFTLGTSAVGVARDFFVDSLKAVERLGARAVFLTGSHPQGLRDPLPGGVFAAPYAPHERVFPRAAAIVHQGGVGTTGQALRAGRPMLVAPFAHDQFDNAERVRRLGVGEALPQSRYTAQRAERWLRRLLAEPSYSQAAAKVSESVRAENGAAAAADAIERITGQPGWRETDRPRR